jgi:hypothetical protein
MCAALESEDASVVNRLVQKWLSTNPQIEKPARLPERRRVLTITYVRDAADADEYVRRVREWAREVWGAWSEHQDSARRLIDEATSQIKT